jgi:hypothetical protein
VEVYRANSTDDFSAITLVSSLTSQPITSGWTRITFPAFAVPTTASTGLEVRIFRYDASNDQEWLITGVQLEVGTVATPFEHRSFGEELALCQRYFERVAEPTNSCYSVGTATFANQPRNVLVYKQRKRAIPSISSSAGSEFRFQFSSGNATPSAITTAGIGNDSAFLNASGVTISQNTPFILISNSTSSYIDIDSEL